MPYPVEKPITIKRLDRQYANSSSILPFNHRHPRAMRLEPQEARVTILHTASVSVPTHALLRRSGQDLGTPTPS